VILGGVGGARSVMTDGERPVRSLAVLPFANLTGDSAQLYLAEGITDQLVATLAQNRRRPKKMADPTPSASFAWRAIRPASRGLSSPEAMASTLW
jgi:hypothetical protein